VQSATILVREAFVREFANGKALGSYAGLCATPYSSGGTEREQGISKAGNRRLRTVTVELAWPWRRHQPGSAQISWSRERVGGTGARMRKVMVIALAEAADCSVAVCHPGRGAGGCGHAARDLNGAKRLSLGCTAAQARRIQGASPWSGLARERRPHRAPSTQSGAALLELSRPGCGTVARTRSRRM